MAGDFFGSLLLMLSFVARHWQNDSEEKRKRKLFPLWRLCKGISDIGLCQVSVCKKKNISGKYCQQQINKKNNHFGLAT